jgi:hypothetical protein
MDFKVIVAVDVWTSCPKCQRKYPHEISVISPDQPFRGKKRMVKDVFYLQIKRLQSCSHAARTLMISIEALGGRYLAEILVRGRRYTDREEDGSFRGAEFNILEDSVGIFTLGSEKRKIDLSKSLTMIFFKLVNSTLSADQLAFLFDDDLNATGMYRSLAEQKQDLSDDFSDPNRLIPNSELFLQSDEPTGQNHSKNFRDRVA